LRQGAGVPHGAIDGNARDPFSPGKSAENFPDHSCVKTTTRLNDNHIPAFSYGQGMMNRAIVPGLTPRRNGAPGEPPAPAEGTHGTDSRIDQSTPTEKIGGYAGWDTRPLGDQVRGKAWNARTMEDGGHELFLLG
jgi:hypothetical protein